MFPIHSKNELIFRLPKNCKCFRYLTLPDFFSQLEAFQWSNPWRFLRLIWRKRISHCLPDWNFNFLIYFLSSCCWFSHFKFLIFFRSIRRSSSSKNFLFLSFNLHFRYTIKEIVKNTVNQNWINSTNGLDFFGSSKIKVLCLFTV